jgi:hypothetical protein
VWRDIGSCIATHVSYNQQQKVSHMCTLSLVRQGPYRMAYTPEHCGIKTKKRQAVGPESTRHDVLCRTRLLVALFLRFCPRTLAASLDMDAKKRKRDEDVPLVAYYTSHGSFSRPFTRAFAL